MQVPVELKRKYLDRRIEDIETLIASLDEDDFAPAQKLGHQVKGNAVTFEFPHLAPIGAQIEAASKIKDKDTILSLVESMSSEIRRAQKLFH
jgi:HPt (histidine-containing phosphotransfer) domain-containing protein